MLNRLVVDGFRSLRHVNIEFPMLTVLFGPNAAGKSNVLDAIQFLAAAGTRRTLAEAFDTLRGRPIEAFEFPKGGLPALMRRARPEFSIRAEITPASEKKHWLDYGLTVALTPRSGLLAVRKERLAKVRLNGKVIEPHCVELGRSKGKVSARTAKKIAESASEDGMMDHTVVSNRSLGGTRFSEIEALRTDLDSWRVYSLEPRTAMRSPAPPKAVKDIGQSGENLAAFLFSLRSEENTRRIFDQIDR